MSALLAAVILLAGVMTPLEVRAEPIAVMTVTAAVVAAVLVGTGYVFATTGDFQTAVNTIASGLSDIEDEIAASFKVEGGRLVAYGSTAVVAAIWNTVTARVQAHVANLYQPEASATMGTISDHLGNEIRVSLVHYQVSGGSVLQFFEAADINAVPPYLLDEPVEIHYNGNLYCYVLEKASAALYPSVVRYQYFPEAGGWGSRLAVTQVINYRYDGTHCWGFVFHEWGGRLYLVPCVASDYIFEFSSNPLYLSSEQRRGILYTDAFAAERVAVTPPAVADFIEVVQSAIDRIVDGFFSLDLEETGIAEDLAATDAAASLTTSQETVIDNIGLQITPEEWAALMQQLDALRQQLTTSAANPALEAESALLDQVAALEAELAALRRMARENAREIAGKQEGVEGLLEDAETLIDSLTDTLEATDTKVTELEGTIADLREQIATLTQEAVVNPPVVVEGEIDWTILTDIAVFDKFPFSLPGDVMAFFEALSVPPREPVFEVDIFGGLFGDAGKITLDFKRFENIRQLVRSCILILLVVALVAGTKNFIWTGGG